YAWAGYRAGLPAIHYWGPSSVAAPGDRKLRLDRALRREVYLDATLQDEGALRRTARLIAATRPHAILAYTQALASFARWADESGARDWPDAVVVCGAEALLPDDRRALERAFG